MNHLLMPLLQEEAPIKADETIRNGMGVSKSLGAILITPRRTAFV
jgi:hypothetical protein